MNDLIGEVSMGPGWSAFLDPQKYWQYGLILLAATLSGAALAYHPVYNGRPSTMESIELKKTLIIYAAVGALIAIICTVNPSMAFVIFGIGGLMRFRTQLGASKSTGHAIMGTLIGLCWGLGLEMVAVFSTVYFWAMIYFLERTTVVELTVGGVKIPQMGPATEAYRKAIINAGGRVCSHSKNFKKVQMTFVFKMPHKVVIDNVVAEVEKISEDLKGTPDWPE
ncbi:MAG: hypothetical protein GY847_05675 [Proteobacteria bacterium]|nr:hypothetical protein [Pseudomonadota bacterium]